MQIEVLRQRSRTFFEDRAARGLNSLKQKTYQYLEDRVVRYADRVLDNMIVVRSSKKVDEELKKLLLNGIPITYGPHEGHVDGAAFAHVAAYYRRLVAGIPECSGFRGLVVPMAKSWAEGQQGRDLKSSYDVFKGPGEKMGLVGIPGTRYKDVEKYDIAREAMEMRPMIKKLREGFGAGILPEGSIQGGRTNPETGKIYGMQRVKNDRLIGLYEAVERVGERSGKRPFFAPVAFYGSFRFVKSTENPNDVPKLTILAKVSFILGSFGVPLLRTRAVMLEPFTEEDIKKDLGESWRKDSDRFNAYAMGRLRKGLPKQAWGDYA